jgi:hypothetical protein
MRRFSGTVYHDNRSCLNLLLPNIEQQIGDLETELVEIDRLTAGKRWFENNENSAGHIQKTRLEIDN